MNIYINHKTAFTKWNHADKSFPPLPTFITITKSFIQMLPKNYYRSHVNFSNKKRSISDITSYILFHFVFTLSYYFAGIWLIYFVFVKNAYFLILSGLYCMIDVQIIIFMNSKSSNTWLMSIKRIINSTHLSLSTNIIIRFRTYNMKGTLVTISETRLLSSDDRL